MFKLEASQYILVYHSTLAGYTHGHTHTHTVGHFSMRLCDFSAHAMWAWQRMSACLPTITHLRRENQQYPQKLNTLIGARLEQGLQIRGTCSDTLLSQSEPIIARD